jgi:RNA polymerase sigma-70 factor, ECF subfamily
MTLALPWPFWGVPEVGQPVRVVSVDSPAPLEPLVQAAREGDVQAFDVLYRRTRQDAYRALYQLVGRTPDIEDLVQQVYVVLTSAIRRFRGDAKFSTFLHGICANVAMTYLRSRRRRPEDPVDEIPDQPSTSDSANPEKTAHTRQAAALMERVLDQMAPKKRVVFVYHELMGMTAEEIAEAVDTSANTVRSRLHHARLEFAEVLARLRKEGALP